MALPNPMTVGDEYLKAILGELVKLNVATADLAVSQRAVAAALATSPPALREPIPPAEAFRDPGGQVLPRPIPSLEPQAVELREPAPAPVKRAPRKLSPKE